MNHIALRADVILDEAFDFDIPVVTLPTNFINGRFTDGFYKYMNINGLSAKDEIEYLQAINKISE